MNPGLLPTLFWTVILLPAYSYALFPLLIVAVGRVAGRRSRARPDRGAAAGGISAPDVAVVVSAYNEERHVERMLASLRTLEYPGRIRYYIGSDGSCDRTDQILRAQSDEALRLFVFTRNRGKASVLNDLVEASREPIIVFTDANTQLEPGSISRLVRHFQDPRVGVVCGELRLRAAGAGDNVDGIYWRIERLLKINESRIGALLGANGGLYAIRRECYEPIEPDTVVDDFCIAMSAAAAGWRLVYETGARAAEDHPNSIQEEFKRRVRIGIGNYQAFFRHPEYLFGINARTFWVYLSHKVLRWFTPHLLLLALFINGMLVSNGFYRFLLLAQLFLYATCLSLYAVSGHCTLPRLLRLPVFLAALNLAFGIGFGRYVTGRYSGTWRRSVRA